MKPKLGRIVYFEDPRKLPKDVGYVLVNFPEGSFYTLERNRLGFSETLDYYDLEEFETLENIIREVRKRVPFCVRLYVQRNEEKCKEVDDDWSIDKDPEFKKDLLAAQFPRHMV